MTPAPRRERLARRFVRHHIPLALVTALVLAAGYAAVESPDARYRWSMSTAYVGLTLIGTMLAAGPVLLLRGQRVAVSTDLRRNIGFWAAGVSVAHVVVGIPVHMGSPWLYFFADGFPGTLALRDGLFGFANYAGLAATLVVVGLAAVSSDVALKRLGRDQWKSSQRWKYGLFGLVAVHGIAFQIVESRLLPFVVVHAALALGVLLLQLVGVRAYRRRAALT